MSVTSMLAPTMERHELKYAIPWRYVEPISQFIEPYCSLDQHSAPAPDQFYQVNSLYLDTRDLEFLRQRQYGKDGRFNMRVRCYGEQGEAPYFLEVKRKSGGFGKKYRSTAEAGEWPAILSDPSYRIPERDNERNRANKELFLRLATSYAVEPKILTCYRRRAFFSTVNEYARVTMDIGMKYRLQQHYRFDAGGDMISYDNETIYERDMYSDAAVILELKSNIGQIPLWMIDLIARFDLKQQGFSKYMSSSLVSLLDDGNRYMNHDRKLTGSDY